MAYPIHLDEQNDDLNLLIGERKLCIHQGDILSVSADALVCPVDQNLDFRSGIARQISRSAGKTTRSERPLSPEPFGKVVVLPGGNLKVKYLFLAVLVGERGIEKMRHSIRLAVDRSIRFAEFLRLKSVAFPTLGCPEQTPPYRFIAKEMMEEVVKYFQRRNTKINAILFSTYNNDAYAAFKEKARELADQ